MNWMHLQNVARATIGRPYHDPQVQQALDELYREHPHSDLLRAGYEKNRVVCQQVVKFVSPGQRFLDIGCGGMGKTIIMQKLGCCCTGLDDFLDGWHVDGQNRDNLISYANSQGVDVRVADASQGLPFDDSSFDAVGIFDVLEHFHHTPRHALNEVGRVLRPGGRVIISLPNSVNLRKRLSVALGRSNYPPLEQMFVPDVFRGHVRENTLSEAAELLRMNNFRVLHSCELSAYLFKLRNPVLRGIYAGLTTLREGFADTVLAVGERPDGWQPA